MVCSRAFVRRFIASRVLSRSRLRWVVVMNGFFRWIRNFLRVGRGFFFRRFIRVNKVMDDGGM